LIGYKTEIKNRVSLKIIAVKEGKHIIIRVFENFSLYELRDAANTGGGRRDNYQTQEKYFLFHCDDKMKNPNL